MELLHDHPREIPQHEDWPHTAAIVDRLVSTAITSSTPAVDLPRMEDESYSHIWHFAWLSIFQFHYSAIWNLKIPATAAGATCLRESRRPIAVLHLALSNFARNELTLSRMDAVTSLGDLRCR